MRLTFLLALATMACAPTRTPAGTDPVAGSCDATRLGDLVGRPFSAGLRADALRRSGARTARVIRPGDVVTMDYRGDRLNIHLTADDRAERFTCG
jgi:hypothetical protein